MIRCAVFDFDGTLVDSNEIKRRVFFEVAAELDPEGAVVREAMQRWPGADRYRMTRAVATLLAERGALPDATSVDEISKRWAGAYTRRCESEIARAPEIPGAGAALRALADREVALFIDSATPTEALTTVVARRGLAGLFRGVYGAAASKLENLRRIASVEGLDAASVVFVGDGEDDRQAALAFGCAFVGVAPAGGSRFAGTPEHTLPDLRGLPGLIERLGVPG